METVKFVIVGHVDHGKSTLIGRLLYDTKSLPPDRIKEIEDVSKNLSKETEFAYLLDHLEEERQQGITIDTTQVFFKTEKRHYVIIDAPGHVAFVKNMITGASQAEAAVLIIDAKEGMEEQTRRHAYILSLLGLKQVIVVLNKMDLVDFNEARYNEVIESAKIFLSSIGIEALSYLPICATKGDNIATRSSRMAWYKEKTFLEALDMLPVKDSPENKSFIFPIQDIYKWDEKRIVVGKIEAGRVACHDTVKVLPDGAKTKVKSVEKFQEEVTEGCAGQSIGVTLEDPLFVNRGNVMCVSGEEATATNTFRANIFWLAKTDFDIKNKIGIRCATQETTCKIRQIEKRINSSTLEVVETDAQCLKNLDVAEAIIETKSPLVIKNFEDVQELGRFVLVQDEDICAGGIIVSL